MVNEKAKEIIHEALERRKDWMSGESLSELTGISRVAVWKHLQGMKEQGYPLESGRRGYRLTADEDTLLPWVFGKFSHRIRTYPVLESTMIPAGELASEGEPDGTVVLAERQTGGKGRLDREWDSPRGGLYFTLILRPPGPISRAGLFTLAAVSALRLLLKEEYRTECYCKWPNDLVTPRGKIAGVLTEVCGSIESMKYLNLGVGINVWNPSDSGSSPERDSLLGITGQRIRRREVLKGFLERFDRLYRLPPAGILDAWTRGFPFTDAEGPFSFNGEMIRGSLGEIFSDGSLTMATPKGILRFHPGDPVRFPDTWEGENKSVPI